MKNIPNVIWLHIGENTPDNADFNELGDITWCKDKNESNAIKYISSSYVTEMLLTIAKVFEILKHPDKINEGGD